VIGDNAAGMERVADHLRALGHTRIALISGTADASTSRDRVAAFPDVEVVAGDFTFERARAAALDLLSRPDRPTAIATVNDLTALAVLNVADELGIAVPGELSVTGYDDIPMAGWSRFALTTVRQPLAEMAARATDLLQGRIDAPDAPPSRVVFPAELIERGSTGPPPTQ
jgi:LacI family transcriptional regulator